MMNNLRVVVTPRIDYERCQVCEKCLAAKECRFKAIIRIDRDEAPAGVEDAPPACRPAPLARSSHLNKNEFLAQ